MGKYNSPMDPMRLILQLQLSTSPSVMSSFIPQVIASNAALGAMVWDSTLDGEGSNGVVKLMPCMVFC